MKTITNNKELFVYLYDQLQKAEPKVPEPGFMDVLEDILMTSMLDGGWMSGMDLDPWIFIFEDLLKVDEETDTDKTMSKALAGFTADLLSDLANRGCSGRISLEQVLLMQIGSLDWADRFQLRASGNFPTLKLRKRFIKSMELEVRLVLDSAAMADLNYSIQS